MAQSNKNTGKKLPAFVAYYVPERDGAPWVRLGAAWAHQDGKGFSLDLELMPTNGGRITLRVFEPKQDQTEGEGA
jgi:hypothetical protein